MREQYSSLCISCVRKTEMKKVVKTIAEYVMITIGVLFLFIVPPYVASFHDEEAVIVAIYDGGNETEIVIVETSNGNEWGFRSDPHCWEIGETVVVVFKGDEIVNARR